MLYFRELFDNLNLNIKLKLLFSVKKFYHKQISLDMLMFSGKMQNVLVDMNHFIKYPFTTQPTGSGTGLGLSLSYDTVKAHGGELKVESTENIGTEFIIQLPI